MFLRFLITILRIAGRFTGENTLLPAEIRSLLIVELTRLGDVLAMLPAIRKMQVHFPSAMINILVDTKYESLLKGIDVDCKIIGINNPDSLRSSLNALRIIRKQLFDLTCSMSTPKRNAVLTLASRSRFKVGYLTYVDSLTPYLESTTIDAFGFRVAERVSYGKENVEERALKICSVLGIDPVNEVNSVELKPDAYWSIRNRLTERMVIPERKYIAIHPFSGWEFRSWKLERFNALVNRILSELEYDVIVLCVREELAGLQSKWKHSHHRRRAHFFCSDDLLETAVILKGALLFIGNDSGPLHLASALGVPHVGLFGPATPALTAPRSPLGEYLYKPVECSPCNQRRCVRPENPCIELHEVDEVFSAVVRTLRASVEEPASANA